METKTTVLAVLGSVTIGDKPIRVQDMGGESAYMMETIRLRPGQTCPIELCRRGTDVYIRIQFAGTVVASWRQAYVGQEKTYTWFDRSTWSLAGIVAGSTWKGRTIALDPGYKVAQHAGESGPATYESGAPMLRIVKVTGEAIGVSKAYPSPHAPDGIWREAFL